MKQNKSIDNFVLYGCWFLAFIIFIFDVSLPLGIAGAVPYSAVVLVSIMSSQRALIYVILATCTLLTIIGYFFSPEGGEVLTILANRGLALFAIWAAGLIGALLQDTRIKLYDNEKRSKSIVEAVPAGVVMVNQKGEIAEVNKAAESLFGYDRDELMGEKIEILVPHDHRDQHLGHRDEYASHAEPHNMGEGRDLQGLCKDGSVFPLEIGLNPLETHEGRMTLAMIVDISERKRSEEKLKASENIAKLIIEASPVGMLTVNEKGNITLVNAVTQQLFGYDEDELLGMNIDAMVPQQFRDGHHKHRDRYFKHPEARTMGGGGDLEAQRKDGSLFPVEIGLSSFETVEGRVALATVMDITRRKRHEGELRKFAEELEASNKELDDFAYIASHDLKEPLRGINNYSVFLAEDYGDKLDDEGQAKLATMSRLCRHMENLIDTLLKFSRVGRVELAYGPRNLDEVVDDILDSIHVTLEEQNVEIRRPQPLPVINCDGARIGEVFRNLITNALKYNVNSEKWIEIGHSEFDENEAETSPLKIEEGKLSSGDIVFYVRDNGIGIQEKHLDSIFGIFKRLHGRNKYGGGTGAGLTIVKKIVERHGGRVWVESTVGKGTTFYFTLS